MKIKNVSKVSEITDNSNKINIGLFTDNSNPEQLLFYCNLLDNSFSYYNLKEQAIRELSKSKIKFNALFINKSLNSEITKLILDYCKKHDVKLIYCPTKKGDINSQKELIKKANVIVADFNLKKSLITLNKKVIPIPQNTDEEYAIINESKLFDSKNYSSKYQLKSEDKFDSIDHYVTLGIYENCNPFKELDLNTFLKSFPELKKFKINPFVYYVILTQLYKFKNYTPFEKLFKHPVLSRLILWDKNNTLIKEINNFLENEFENDFSFEISLEDNNLLFKQENEVPHFKHESLMGDFTKNHLMIKHRGTGKRILKEINNGIVELTGEDLLKINEMWIYDIYVQVSTLNKDFLYRVNFDEDQNNFKILRDTTNNRIFDAYETSDKFIAFKYQNANFIVERIDAINNDGKLMLDGEITLFESINYNNIELVMSLNQNDVENEYITCDHKQDGNMIKFNGEIDFEYHSSDLGKNFKIDVHLKDSSGIIVSSRYLRGDKLNSLKDTLRQYVKPTVFFESFHGQFYSGQPKYIYEKMLAMGLGNNYNFVWAYQGEEEIPGEPQIIARRSKHYNDILTASSYWITNMSFPILKPSDDIIYVQTTHGTPYKKMGSDIETEDEKIAKGRVLIESDTWNYLISPNDHSKEIFVRSFEYDGPVINRGYPANDIFYEDTTLKQQELKEKFNIDPNKKVILYCPTFRDFDVDESNHRRFSLLVDLQNLFENVCDDYVIIMRLHYLVSNQLTLTEEMKESIIDLSNYDDVADLYLISDILISDYSSAFFDFAHSKKPILFFVPDFEEYSAFRGLYSVVKDNLPGPEIYTDEDLVKCIKNIDKIEKEYKEKYDKFYEMFCGIGHGTASEDVVTTIFGEDNHE